MMWAMGFNNSRVTRRVSLLWKMLTVSKHARLQPFCGTRDAQLILFVWYNCFDFFFFTFLFYLWCCLSMLLSPRVIICLVSIMTSFSHTGFIYFLLNFVVWFIVCWKIWFGHQLKNNKKYYSEGNSKFSFIIYLHNLKSFKLSTKNKY